MKNKALCQQFLVLKTSLKGPECKKTNAHSHCSVQLKERKVMLVTIQIEDLTTIRSPKIKIDSVLQYHEEKFYVSAKKTSKSLGISIHNIGLTVKI